jgi:hypothetical protein
MPLIRYLIHNPVVPALLLLLLTATVVPVLRRKKPRAPEAHFLGIQLDVAFLIVSGLFLLALMSWFYQRFVG